MIEYIRNTSRTKITLLLLLVIAPLITAAIVLSLFASFKAPMYEKGPVPEKTILKPFPCPQASLFSQAPSRYCDIIELSSGMVSNPILLVIVVVYSAIPYAGSVIVLGITVIIIRKRKKLKSPNSG